MNWGFICLLVVLAGIYDGVRPDCNTTLGAIGATILVAFLLGVLAFLVFGALNVILTIL